jgi:DNA-binding NarL/FixJ family response regulator
MESLRIVLADDHAVVRQGLRSLLEEQGWKVVAETATGKDAVTKVREFKTDIAILDISMPSLNGKWPRSSAANSRGWIEDSNPHSDDPRF